MKVGKIEVLMIMACKIGRSMIGTVLLPPGLRLLTRLNLLGLLSLKSGIITQSIGVTLLGLRNLPELRVGLRLTDVTRRLLLLCELPIGRPNARPS